MRLIVPALFALLFTPFAAFAQAEPDPTPAPAPVQAEAPVDVPVDVTPEPTPTVVTTPAAVPVVVAPAAPVAEEKKETSVFGKIFGGDSDKEKASAPSGSSPDTPAALSEKAAAIKASNARHSEENADERDERRREFIQERNQRKADLLARAASAPRPVAPVAPPVAAPAVAPVAATPAVAPAAPAANDDVKAEEVESE